MFNVIRRTLYYSIAYLLVVTGAFWAAFTVSVIIAAFWRALLIMVFMIFAVCMYDQYSPKLKAVWNRRFATYSDARGSFLISR